MEIYISGRGESERLAKMNAYKCRHSEGFLWELKSFIFLNYLMPPKTSNFASVFQKICSCRFALKKF